MGCLDLDSSWVLGLRRVKGVARVAASCDTQICGSFAPYSQTGDKPALRLYDMSTGWSMCLERLGINILKGGGVHEVD